MYHKADRTLPREGDDAIERWHRQLGERGGAP